MDTEEGVEGDGMNWEIGTDIHTLLILCIKQIINESPLYSSANSTQWSVATYKMGGNSPKEEICVYASLIHCALQLKLTQHCKATVPQ